MAFPTPKDSRKAIPIASPPSCLSRKSQSIASAGASTTSILPVEDGEPVHARKLDSILDALSENIRWGTVLIHCAQGTSRAPSMAAAYMDAVGFKSITEAIKEIQRVRPFIHPSSTLLDSIRRHLA